MCKKGVKKIRFGFGSRDDILNMLLRLYRVLGVLSVIVYFIMNIFLWK
jgi:hypothetical protein